MTRSTSSARGGGSNWTWLLVLLLVGAAVLAARTFGRQDAGDTRVVAVTATAAVAPTRTPNARIVEARQASAVTPTPARVRPGATPTPRTAAAAPTATPSRVVQPTATHIAAATVIPPTATLAATPAHAPTGEVELTFDAGADRGYAEDILDRLADEHVVASFGITGNWAKANPDVVRRMVAEGHLVFNHTLDHRSFTGVSDSLGGLSAGSRRSELEQADAIIAPLVGHTTKPFYRLPYGDDDAHVAADVASVGYSRKIGWTVDSLGWRGLLTQDIVARCLKLAAPGAVYVFHVGRASQDALALPQVVAGLRERGFSFARVDQL